MISSYGDQSITPGNNPSYYYRASPTLPQLLWILPEHLMFYTCNYNIRVTHRNGAIKHIFTRIRSTEGSSADCSLFILSLHALALHLAVKILLQIFLYEDLGVDTYMHLSVVFPSRMPAGPLFVTQPILLSENIPNIWHKSSTKHKEVRPDWNDKNDNANCAPRITWKVLPMAQVAIFKEIFDQVRKDLDGNCFILRLKRQRLTLYLLSSHR